MIKPDKMHRTQHLNLNKLLAFSHLKRTPKIRLQLLKKLFQKISNKKRKKLQVQAKVHLNIKNQIKLSYQLIKDYQIMVL
jgi:hypothetical protein